MGRRLTAGAVLLVALALGPPSAHGQILIVLGSVINQGQLDPLIPLPSGTVLGASDVYKAFLALSFTDDTVVAYDIAQGVAYSYSDRVAMSLSDLSVNYDSDLLVWDPNLGGFAAYTDGTDLNTTVQNGTMVLLNSSLGESQALGSGLGAYLTGDVFPSSGDSSGSFGDGSVNTLDLLAVLRAVAQIPGSVPPACSDLFDAMDVFPPDGSTRGGDGLLNTLDLLAVLRRVAGLDTSAPMRLPRNGSCVGTQSVEVPVEAQVVLRREKDRDGRVAILLHAERDLELAGLSLGLEGTSFAAAQGRQPTLLDTALPGVIAVAWLDEISLKAGESIALGELSHPGVPKVFALSLGKKH
jgi:hypothetical protein